MKQALIVFAKELADALRDRRTLMRMLLPALLQQAGESRFEDAFVKLAFPEEAAA